MAQTFYTDFSSGIPSQFIFDASGYLVETLDVPSGFTHALQTRDIDDSETLEFSIDLTFESAGTVSFWRKVSSESVKYDYFIFYIDGVEQFKIGGTSDVWTKVSYNVGAGNHTFRWTYRKDGSDSSGFDSGFITGFTATNVDLTLLGCTQNNKIITEYFSEYWVQGIEPFKENFDNIDMLDYISFDRAGYAIVTGDTPPGYKHAIKTRETYLGEEGSFTITLYFEKSGTFSFWWKADCADYNYFYFYVDEVRYFSDDIHTWQFLNYNATAGIHTFRFTYNKSSIVKTKSDSILISGIVAYNVLPGVVLQNSKVKHSAYFNQDPSIITYDFKDNLDTLPTYFGLDNNAYDIVPIKFAHYTKALKIRPYLDLTVYEEYMRLKTNFVATENCFVSMYIKSSYPESRSYFYAVKNEYEKPINKRVYINSEFTYVELSFSPGQNTFAIEIDRYLANPDYEILITGIRIVNINPEIFIQPLHIYDDMLAQETIKYGELQVAKAITTVGYEYVELTAIEPIIKADIGISFESYIDKDTICIDFKNGMSDFIKTDAPGYQVVTTMPPYYALQTRDIGDNQSTYFTISATLFREAKITFYIRLDAQSYNDYVLYSLDGIPNTTISTTYLAWKKYVYIIPPGTHEFKWEYIKNSSSSWYTDSAYYSNITIEGVNTTNSEQKILFVSSGFDEVQVARYPQDILTIISEFNEVQLARYDLPLNVVTTCFDALHEVIRIQTLKSVTRITVEPLIPQSQIGLDNIAPVVQAGVDMTPLAYGGNYCLRSDGKVLVTFRNGKDIYLSVVNSEIELFANPNISKQNSWIFYSGKSVPVLGWENNINHCVLQKLDNGNIFLYLIDTNETDAERRFTIHLYVSYNGLGTDFKYLTQIGSYANSFSYGIHYTSIASLSTAIQLPSGRICIAFNFKWDSYFWGGGTGNFYYSDDYGHSWLRSTTPSDQIIAIYSIGYVNGMVILTTHHVFPLAGWQTQAIYSYDEGATWNSFGACKVDDSDFNNIDFAYGNGDGYCYALIKNDLYCHPIDVPITNAYSWGAIGSGATWELIYTSYVSDATTARVNSDKIVVTESFNIGLIDTNATSNLGSSGTSRILGLVRNLTNSFNIFVITDTGIKQVTQVFIITDTGLKEATQCNVITDTGIK